MQIIAAALLATLAQTSADIEGAYERVSTSRLKFEMRANELVIHFTLPNGNHYEWVWRKLR